jgi:hypothetical protein
MPGQSLGFRRRHYALAVREIARKSPLRVEAGERIVGAAKRMSLCQGLGGLSPS